MCGRWHIPWHKSFVRETAVMGVDAPVYKNGMGT